MNEHRADFTMLGIIDKRISKKQFSEERMIHLPSRHILVLKKPIALKARATQSVVKSSTLEVFFGRDKESDCQGSLCK